MMLMVTKCLVGIGTREVPKKISIYLPSKYFTRSAHRFGIQSLGCLNFCTSSTPCQKAKNEEIAHFVENKNKTFSELSLGQKVKQTGKDAVYLGIILFGIGITGALFYIIGSELVSTQSPNGMYNAAYKLCIKDTKVRNALGEPIKAYGELSSRGRRRHIRYNEFMEQSIKVMNVQFYLEGPHDKATVFVQAKQNAKGKYEITRIILQLNRYPQRKIVVLDRKDELPAESRLT